jgi:hypothetical protein
MTAAMPSDPDTLRQYLAKASALNISQRDQQRLAKLIALAGRLPEMDIAPAGERHLALSVRRKIFTYYLHQHHGDGRVCICCKSTLPVQRDLVLADPQRYFVPAYLGKSGWVSLRLDRPRIDWDEAFELLRDAWRLQAPRRLAAELP